MRKFILIFKTIFVSLVFLTTFSFAANDTGMNQENVKEKLVGKRAMFTNDEFFYVFSERGSPLDHKVPCNWMGDFKCIDLFQNCRDNPQTGEFCMRWKYIPESMQEEGWVGVYWQTYHKSGETQMRDGVDLRQAKKITLWARGEQGNEKIKIKVGGLGGRFPDSDQKTSDVLTLSKDWQQFSVNLEDVDMSFIDGIFCWLTDKKMNPDGCVFYLDNIRYEK
ncbi:MAG: hypothetical protein KJ915_11175 [Candidatus Omnitrophica bacterium]|nr:hypothetical protein [Candidatus Omnitrophota bacterium]